MQTVAVHYCCESPYDIGVIADHDKLWTGDPWRVEQSILSSIHNAYGIAVSDQLEVQYVAVSDQGWRRVDPTQSIVHSASKCRAIEARAHLGPIHPREVDKRISQANHVYLINRY
jgi:hypothetical protein